MIFIWLVLLTSWISSSHGQEFYDSTSCAADGYAPGTRYACSSSNNNSSSFKISCKTFLIFRATGTFPAISNISTLFGSVPDHDLLKLNRIDTASEILFPGREVLVPIKCSCSGNFFRASFNYTVTETTTFSDTACGLYEGLVKTITLIEENPPQDDIIKVGSVLNVPLKCSCPNNTNPNLSAKYLVTYPLILGDDIRKVSSKFGITIDDILLANNLHIDTTIYPNTTILVPLKSEPLISFNIPDPQPPTPGFLPTKPIDRVKSPKLRTMYIAVSVIGFFLVLVILVISGLYINTLSKCKRDILAAVASSHRSPFTSFSTPRVSSQRSGLSQNTRSSPSSCLSPDLLASIKYSLYNFSVDEIKRATKDFSEDCRVGESAYKGLFDDVQVLIKETEFSDIRHVIDVHSKINHVNIVKLVGVCYNELSWSYLVFEYPPKGSLRDCLANPSSFTWHRRTQIAFDVATSLHYLHYCIVPPYMHTGVTSNKIFVTQKWRAKIAVLSRDINPGINVGSSSSDYEIFDILKASEKEDIFEFGVVLLEILSGKERMDGKLLRESIGFLGGEASEGGCFEQLRNFMDPCLKEDYPLAEALCLAVLAKACVEQDPLHRPSMDDILKVLARMV